MESLERVYTKQNVIASSSIGLQMPGVVASDQNGSPAAKISSQIVLQKPGFSSETVWTATKSLFNQTFPFRVQRLVICGSNLIVRWGCLGSLQMLIDWCLYAYDCCDHLSTDMLLQTGR